MQLKDKSKKILALILVSAIVIISFWNPSLVGVKAVKAETAVEEWNGSDDAAWNNEPGVSDGSAEHPFKITTAAQFRRLVINVNNNTDKETSSSIDNYRGKYFSLECDINLKGEAWEPIGTSESKYFAGKFNGNGHTISGLNIKGNYQYAGLFGYTVNASEITALHVKGSVESSYVGNESKYEYGYVGGLIGHMYGGTVKNCVADVEVKGTDVSYGGGFVGYVKGIRNSLPENTTIVKMLNCFAKGSVHCGKTGTGAGYFGGFLGGIYGLGMDGSMNGSMLNCYAVGDVEGTATGTTYVGGFSGLTESGATTNMAPMGLCFWNRDVQQKINGTIVGNPVGCGRLGDLSFGISHALSDTELKSDMVVDYLNGLNEDENVYWVVDKSENDSINGGYPYLKQWTSEETNPYVAKERLKGVFDNTENVTDIGTSSNPYTISSALQLQLLAYNVNKTANFESGAYIELTTNIDLNEMPMAPIGVHGTYPFTCKLNGNGYTISGLKIDGNYTYMGLFGYTNVAEITSLGVQGSINSIFTGSQGYIGGLVGFLNSGIVKNCSVNVAVTGANIYEGGGFAGRVNGSGTTILNCFAIGEVKCGKSTSNQSTGGFAGKILNLDTNSSIMNCYAAGNVEVTVIGTSYMGGFFGNPQVTPPQITCCYWNQNAVQKSNGAIVDNPVAVGTNGANYVKTIQPLSDTHLKSGTLVDWLNGLNEEDQAYWKIDTNKTINRGYPYLEHWVSTEVNPHVRGNLLDGVFDDSDNTTSIGTANNPYTISTAVQLQRLYHYTNMTSNFMSGKYIKLTTDIDLGGLPMTPIGNDASYPFGCNFDGQGHTISNLSLAQTGDYTGLFGYLGEDSAVSRLTVEGTVTTSGSNPNASIGLLAGMVDYGTISFCTVDGSIDDTGSNPNASIGLLAGNMTWANVEGCNALGEIKTTNQANVGGLIGNNQTSTKINSCYAAVDITAGADSLVGGIIGRRNKIVVSGLYWNRDKNQVVGAMARNAAGRSGTGNANEIGITAKTTSEMKKTTFADSLTAALENNDLIWSVDLTTNPVSQGYPYLVSLAPLTGSVTVRGSNVFGKTLTAVTTSLDADYGVGTLSYQWLRDGAHIKGATESEYTLTAEDVGKEVNVKVTASFCSGSKTSGQLVTVAKAEQTAPSSPTEQTKTHEIIILHAVEGMEYRMGIDGMWTDNPAFSDLEKETTYSFYARKAETSTQEASPVSEALSVTTLGTPKLSQIAPEAPVLESKTTRSITIEPILDAEYSVNLVDWQSVTTFEELIPGSTYRIYARIKANDDYYASDISEVLEVTLDKETQEAPSAPILASKSETVIILNTIKGMEYCMDESGIWQSSGVFSDLQTDTEYKLYARLAESATNMASAKSVALIVKLEKMVEVQERYDVTFNLNGATDVVPQAQTILLGNKIEEPTQPLRSGYNFLGWYTEETCKNEWDFDKYGVIKDIVLYAYWEKNPSMPKLTVASGYKKARLSWKQVKDVGGYEIYCSELENGTYKKIKTTKAEAVKCVNKILVQGQTYYYKMRSYKTINNKKVYSDFSKVVEIYVKKINKITFQTNKGSKVNARYVETNKCLKLSKKTLRRGYTFSGWYTDKKLTKKYNFKLKVKSNMELYAKWIEILEKPTVISTSVQSNRVTLSWKQVKKAEGYEIVRVTAKTAHKFNVKSTDSHEVKFTDKGIEAGREYSYKIRAYRKINGKKVYSKYRNFELVTLR